MVPRTRVLLALLLLVGAAAAGALPPAAGTVLYPTDDPAAWLSEEQNRSRALNDNLSTRLRSRTPLADPVEEAIAVATAAVEARLDDVEDAQEENLTRGLQAVLANLQTVRDARAALAGPGTAAERALAVADVGIASRASALAYHADPHLAPALAMQDANVDAARALLGVTGSGLPAAAETARRATLAQADAIGLDLPTSVPVDAYPSPSAAALALLASHGVEPTPAESAALADLDALPQGPRDALRDVLAAFLALQRASVPAAPFEDEALANVQANLIDPAARAGELVNDAFGLAPGPGLVAGYGVEIAPALRARQLLVDAAVTLAAAAEGLERPCEAPLLVPDPVATNVTFVVLALSLDACADAYAHDAVLSIDLGGSDTYTNNAGGNRLGNLCERVIPRVRVPPGATAALDLGEADDQYLGSSCGVNGGAALGVGVLVDAGGNDRYVVPEGGPGLNGAGANGGGHGGIGFLLDAGGNDLYDVRHGGYGVNGGGFFGAGMLIDAGWGDDEYRGTHVAVNGGGEHGFGFLYDGGGPDEYHARPRSANGGAVLGAGYLLDISGVDQYLAPFTGDATYTTASNGGGRFGVGFLADLSGDDVYRGDRDGANGGGWGGVGLLVDADGDDKYHATDNGTNGAGWGRLLSDDEDVADAPVRVGVGMLVDATGNDLYDAGSFGTNGGCYIGGSFFVDGGGDDRYEALDGGGVNGGAGGHSRGSCLAFLLDASGGDSYLVRGAKNPRGFAPDEVEFAGGKGANGGAGGAAGVGFLFDLAGDDHYTANEAGVNGGGWRGVGFLADASGSDRYTAGAISGNGGSSIEASLAPHTGAAHSPGVGFLIDGQGRDWYNATRSGVNGGGFLSWGFLYDGGGVDEYRAGDLAANGGGAGGVGFLLDRGGDDLYVAGATGVNGAATRGEYSVRAVEAGIGRLLDAAGTDTYVETGLGCRRDETIEPKGDRGAGAQKDMDGPVQPVCL